MPSLSEINPLAVLAVAIVHFVMGALWYSPPLFGNQWMRYVGKTAEEIQAGAAAKAYIVSFIAYLVMALVLAVLIEMGGDPGLAKGAMAGALSWLGFVGTTTLATTMFEGRPLGLWAIYNGYSLVGLAVMGAILGAWQ
jgi:hypothetical protein